MPFQSNGQQTSYGFAMRTAFAGMLAFASRIKDVILSAVAAEQIDHGLGLAFDATSGGVRKPRATVATLTFSGVLVTANTVNLNVVINGVITALTATVFATDHATTMAAIATKIAAVPGVASAVVAGNTIVVTGSADKDVRLTGILVTGGGGQATATVPYTSSDSFAGVAVRTEAQLSGAGFVQYEMVGYARRTMGIYVPVSENVSKGDTALLDLATATLGQFKKTAGNTMTTGAKFLSAGTSGGLAILEVNLP